MGSQPPFWMPLEYSLCSASTSMNVASFLLIGSLIPPISSMLHSSEYQFYSAPDNIIHSNIFNLSPVNASQISRCIQSFRLLYPTPCLRKTLESHTRYLKASSHKMELISRSLPTSPHPHKPCLVKVCVQPEVKVSQYELRFHYSPYVWPYSSYLTFMGFINKKILTSLRCMNERGKNDIHGEEHLACKVLS